MGGRRSDNAVRVVCQSCGGHTFRVFKPDAIDVGGYGTCSRLHSERPCGGKLVAKTTRMQERKAARAKAELEALARGERL